MEVFAFLCPEMYLNEKGKLSEGFSGEQRWNWTIAMLITFDFTNEFFSSDYYMRYRREMELLTVEIKRKRTVMNINY